MRHAFLFVLAGGIAAAALRAGPAGANSAPVVANVVAVQIANTGLVRVTYDVSDVDGDQVTARLICSSDNGDTFDLLPVTVSGDINVQMTPGPGKQIIWNAAADYPGRYWTQVVAKVVASDGPATSGEMVFVAAGNFLRGSTSGNSDEQPQLSIYLDAFWIDKFEVTNAEFKQFIDAGGYSTQAFWSAAGWNWRSSNNILQPNRWDAGYPYGPLAPGFPVIEVSWYEAEAYANFAGKRLPTEAEWEKAARGSDARTYPWGEGIDGSRANYSNSGDPFGEGLTPVGFYDGRLHPNPPFQTTDSPSPYNAYDMAGNAWEWVADWYSSTYYASAPSANPLGPLTGSNRVMRGGGWNYIPADSRCARRIAFVPTFRGNVLGGFRCARSGP